MKIKQMLQRKKTFIGATVQDGQTLLLVALRYHRGFRLLWHKRIALSENARTICRNARVVSAIHYDAIISKMLTLDARLKSQEIQQLISLQARENFEDLFNSLVIDFERLKTNSQPGLMDIRWVAAKHSDIQNKIAQLNQFKLPVSAIDVDAFALHYLANFLAQQMHLENILTVIIYIQDQSALMCGTKNAVCLFINHEKQYTDLLGHLLGLTIGKIWLCGQSSSEELIYLTANIQDATGIETTLANPFLFCDLEAVDNISELLGHSNNYALAFALATRACKNEY